MKQHCNIQNNITIQQNKTQKNIATYKQYYKQHNKTQKLVVTYKTTL